jgi:hypothetical protein
VVQQLGSTADTENNSLAEGFETQYKQESNALNAKLEESRLELQELEELERFSFKVARIQREIAREQSRLDEVKRLQAE